MPLGVGPTVAAVCAFILGLGMWYGDWLHWLVCTPLTCHIFSEKCMQKNTCLLTFSSSSLVANSPAAKSTFI